MFDKSNFKTQTVRSRQERLETVGFVISSSKFYLKYKHSSSNRPVLVISTMLMRYELKKISTSEASVRSEWSVPGWKRSIENDDQAEYVRSLDDFRLRSLRHVRMDIDEGIIELVRESLVEKRTDVEFQRRSKNRDDRDERISHRSRWDVVKIAVYWYRRRREDSQHAHRSSNWKLNSTIETSTEVFVQQIVDLVDRSARESDHAVCKRRCSSAVLRWTSICQYSSRRSERHLKAIVLAAPDAASFGIDCSSLSTDDHCMRGYFYSLYATMRRESQRFHRTYCSDCHSIVTLTLDLDSKISDWHQTVHTIAETLARPIAAAGMVWMVSEESPLLRWTSNDGWTFGMFSHQERRTIVRQDERPANFYIILSGSAIPTYKRATDGTIETLDVLKRGSTFGVRTIFPLPSDPSFLIRLLTRKKV